MKNLVFNYLLKNFLKTFLVCVLITYCFGMVLNLFEEIEFFKNNEVSLLIPLMLTSIFVPSIIIKLLPFIIFISSMWFMLQIRSSKDLLTLKIYGYSNLRIFFILAFTSFFLGWVILIVANPITSSMVKFYEKTKSQYARDIEHLVTFNNNGLWIKESTDNGDRVITAAKIDKLSIMDIKIFHFNEKYNLYEKIFAKKANIETNNWDLSEVVIFEVKNGIFERRKMPVYKINSIYNYEKITSLFSNSDTVSLLELILDYNRLLNNGYNERFLNQSLHSMLSLPFFLFLMTGIASILTMNTLKKSDNFKFIILGLIISVFVYYFKDLSIALGQTDRIPLELSIWAPIIALSLFTFIGVLQINEK